jgi:hypothetical protein
MERLGQSFVEILENAFEDSLHRMVCMEYSAIMSISEVSIVLLIT